jgi:hypothetical protein
MYQEVERRAGAPRAERFIEALPCEPYVEPYSQRSTD